MNVPPLSSGYLKNQNRMTNTSQKKKTASFTLTTATTPQNCSIRHYESTSQPAKYWLSCRLTVAVCHTDVYKIRRRQRQKPDNFFFFTSVFYFLQTCKSFLVGGNYFSDVHPSTILQYFNDNVAVSDCSSPYCVPRTRCTYKKQTSSTCLPPARL